ncbi:MAG: SRPBCC family protein [Gammaproteobacteria bacterium]|nr:SRPBCC family protein [Gammaproteobacteria bacterium]MDH4254613.1 SRPBCC family protein [Gammaproteobacteria bacterium]MDH5310977.1 SRPBCC family protein [Gammaproteobacteria bacterium]
MDENEYGERIGPGTIRFRRLLPGPIERVWDYLTKPDLRGQWLASGKTELLIGGRIELHFHNSKLSRQPDVEPPDKYKDEPEQAIFTGVVTRCEPPYLLAHTWTGDGENTEVCYELAERGDRVLLTLTHMKLDTSELELGVLGGWHRHLEILADRLAGREPEAFWRRYRVLDAAYERRLAAQD